MAFTVTGMYEGEQITVTWDSGKLTGELDDVSTVKFLIRDAELLGDSVGPIGGPSRSKRIIESGLSVLHVVLRTCTDVQATGDVPTPPTPASDRALI